MMRVHEPGIYTMAEVDYHADPCPEPSLSATICHWLCGWSPAHAFEHHPRLNPHFEPEHHERLDLGKAAHALLLEGPSAIRIVDGVEDYRTQAARALRDKIRADGRTPLLRRHWDTTLIMTSLAQAQLSLHGEGRRMFRGGQVEQVLVWEENGTWCRARIDYYRPGAIDEYKTTHGSANPIVLARSMFATPGTGWDIQAAWYMRGIKALLGDAYAQVRFAVQECERPYALSVVSLAPSALMLAEKKVLFALETWRRCLASHTWPAYGTEVAYMTMPEWVEAQWLAREEEQSAH
jgi:PDDEXK-like domain of unknown function (DUF3799)